MRDFEKIRAEAEKGDAKAQYALGVLYYYGNGVAQDHKVAEQWFHKAAAQGHALARDRLKKAAEQGDAEAQYSLGEICYHGWGVAEDEAQAMQWFRKAAAQGHALAQERLRVLYPKGQGVERDDEERKKQEEAQAPERQIEKFLQENKNLVDKFLEIAERKVSRLDEYGHENWKALRKEIWICIGKLLETSKENSSIRQELELEWKVLRRRNLHRLGVGEEELKDYLHLGILIHCLETLFRKYHDEQKKKPESDVKVWEGMSGVEFETCVAKLLKDKGYDVRGTPAADQGADLIATKNGKKIVIQVKRYAKPVGNAAVQEVAAARNHYAGDEAWVVTNSNFTPAAKDLARTNAVRLINGDMLKKNNF